MAKGWDINWLNNGLKSTEYQEVPPSTSTNRIQPNHSNATNVSRATTASNHTTIHSPVSCKFCLKNSEPLDLCTSHDFKRGDDHCNITCPILRKFICGKCGETGDESHTIKYCTHSEPRN